MSRRRKYGFSFSWRRASGLSAMKGRISREMGIPLTRSGRQRKVARAMGCCLPFLAMIGIVALPIAGVVAVLRHLG